MARFTRIATIDEALSHTLDELLDLGLLPPILGAQESEEEEEAASGTEAEETSAASESTTTDDDEDTEDEGAKPAETNWKQMARKHEREAKKRQKEIDELKAQIKARADQDLSEHEKAIEQARQEAVKELEIRHEQERRQDRLEVASTKLAARGIQIGEGEKAKMLKFADPDDALVYLERDIASGKLDAEDLFDDRGRVKEDELVDALTDLLARKPHLASDGKQGAGKVKGSADAGKGTPAKTDGTVEEHFQKIRRNRPQAAPQFAVTRRS